MSGRKCNRVLNGAGDYQIRAHMPRLSCGRFSLILKQLGRPVEKNRCRAMAFLQKPTRIR